jgi:hypothetical protein
MDGSQALVARRHPTASLVLDFLQEGSNLVGREVFNPEPIDRPPDGLGHEGQEQTKRVTVALLRVAGEVALADEVFQQEAPDPRAEQARVSHD